MPKITVIGAGPGGYTAAFAAAKAGAEVTLIEADAMGGTCLNYGCIPTKTLKASADALEMAHRFAEFGIQGIGDARADMPAIIARKEKVCQVLRTGLERSCKLFKVNLIRGKGTVVNAGEVAVSLANGSVTEIKGDHVVLATGSTSMNLPALPIDHKKILTSDDALMLQSPPARLLIVGGGVIGCEMAFIYKAFGSSVTLVEGQGRLLPLPSVDEEMSNLLRREVKKNGIAVLFGSTVNRVEVLADGSVKAIIGPSPFMPPGTQEQKTEEETIVDAVLVTVGRTPNTAGLGLAEAGVTVDGRGWITVNEKMETTVPGIYAIGDVLGPEKIMLAHVAAMEGLCAAANCLGGAEIMDYRVVPSVIFTRPEIATVGITEADARARGMEIKTHQFQMRELGKAQAMGELAGVFKLICSAGSGKLLGAHIAGAHATDLIAEAALAIQMGATAADIARTIHAHPTLAEGIYEAALRLSGR